MKLNDLIKERRRKRGWSLETLAKKAGLDRSTVKRIEDGASGGRAGSISEIIRVLKIDPLEAARLQREEQEESEAQYLDLSRVPREYRPHLRRSIDALVREYESEEEEKSEE